MATDYDALLDDAPEYSDNDDALSDVLDSTHLSAPVSAVLDESEIKALDDTHGLRPDELALPDALPDPHNMAFTDEEIEALTITDSDEAVKLAFGLATAEKRALLKAEESE